MDNSFINLIIDDEGKYNYAYVVMLINKDVYATASIVIAESLRKNGCLGDLIIMIDKKILPETVNMIKKFYNKIILIETIEILNDDPIQNIILSKINAFKLDNYKKIFLIDVDTIVFTNIDNYLVNYTTPSIGLSDGKKNYGFLLIEPSEKLFSKALNLVKKHSSELKKIKKPFEFILNNLFSDIKELPLEISSKNYSNIDIIQYQGDKPFLMTSSLTIEERMRLDHFKIWFSYFISILNKYPELKKISSIQETIDVSKYFLAPMSRFVIQIFKSNKTKKLKQVSHIYGQNKYNNLDYYHLDISKDYSGEYINYTSNINNFDVFLQFLTSNSKIDFIKFNKVNKFNNPKNLVNFFINKENEETEEKNKIKYKLLKMIFLNYYVKIFPNVFVIFEILNNDDKVKKKNIISNLNIDELKNNLLYNNYIKITGQYLSNILFCILQNYTYTQRIEMLKKIKPESEYLLNYYIYETVGQINMFDMIDIESNLFVLFDKSSKMRFGSVFFNPNTITMFENYHKFCNYINYINKTKIISKQSLINLIYFQTLKKWIYNVYSGDQIQNIIIGEKKINKLNSYIGDLILIDNVTNNISKIKKINNNKILFVEIIFIKASQYKNILPDKEKIIDSISNPNNHWELEGIKFLIEKMN